MKVADFHFDLPDALIARQPTAERTASRLLCVDGSTGELKDRTFNDILGLLNQDDLLIFNNTKVIPARLMGQKSTGGKVEVLVERVLDDHRVLAHVRANKSPKPGNTFLLEGSVHATMLARHEDLFELSFDHPETVFELLDQHGHMPLPPYIDRPDTEDDRERYQTVYGTEPGAVAAPTAGLHFDDNLIQSIKDKGIDIGYVTLHVGAGTFQSVRVDDIKDHQMHSEYAVVDKEVIDKIKACKDRGGRVIAVGTTSVRSLESAAQSAKSSGSYLIPFSDDTSIFIYPGYEFLLVDGMITNFHLPESTLIMLVSAFMGKDTILKAYRHAVESEYRFFSYGDAMFLTP